MGYHRFLIIFSSFFMLSPLARGAKNFVYCSEGSPSSFNPQVATDGTTYNATRPVYDKLVEVKYGETALIPGLAESWEASHDGLNYLFHLRKGVKFHKTSFFSPTRLFTADDVLFSFNRQRLKTHPYFAVGHGNYEYFTSMDMQNLIKDIVKIDDYTVKFVLNHAEAPFLANLAMDFASILSAEYGEFLLKKNTPEKMDYEPVGTGPFIFHRYDKDEVIRYVANPDFFRGKPKIDHLIFSITPEPSVRFQKLRTGECDFATEPSPDNLPAMKANPSLKVMEKPGLNVGYLAMNVEKPPFNNLLVRQAINYALNRQSYIEAIYLGHAIIAKNPLPPTSWAYNNEVKDFEFDPKRAKALLEKAGFPNGFSTELWTLPVARPYLPNGKKMGEMMQADLASVGIKTRLITYDWPTYLAKSKNGEHSLLQMGWTADNSDPDNFLEVLLACSAVEAGGNRARWCSKPYDKLVIEAGILSQQKIRTERYQKAQEIFKREAPWVTLAHAVVYRAMSKRVVGYQIDPFGADIFEQVDIQ